MPSRILQTLSLTLFGLILLLIDKSSETCLWFIIPSGILAIACFVFAKPINDYWFSRHIPVLDDYEIKWVSNFLPYFQNLEDTQKLNFLKQLAMELKSKDFVAMTDKKLPEELKIMALAPALRLGLYASLPAIKKYHKIVFYHSSFPSPQFQFLHLSETFHEDGVLIFASDALQAAHVNPDQYLNTALYEWSSVFISINNLQSNLTLSEEESWLFIEKILRTEKKRLHDYMGIPNMNTLALLIYCYIMYPEKLALESDKTYKFINKLID